MIVIDASFVGPLLLPDERATLSTAAADAIFASPIIVPMHWHLEVASIVQNAIRRGRIDRAAGMALLRDEALLDPEVDRETAARAWGVTHPLAERLGLTVYDAAYLELAMRRGASLATLDARLAAAATAEGVPVVQIA